MRTRLKLRPGQRGTKKLLATYGDQLICVRYRYDAVRKKRYKTVELIVDVVAWDPPDPPYWPSDVVTLRLGWVPEELFHALIKAGGRWMPKVKVWRLRFAKVQELGLTRYIVKETARHL